MYGKNRRRAAKPSPAAKPVPLPDALLEGVERPRASVAEFRRPARRYTLVMAGADARELFLSLARENDFNLVLSPEVSGTVTMDIKEATAEELMDEVCGMLRCRAVFGGNTVRVAPEKRVTRVFTVDYLLTGRTGTGSLMASTSASGGGGSGGSTTTSESQSTNSVITEEKADFWGGLAEEIGALLSPGSGKVVVNRTSGTVTVTDYMANVEQVERHLRMIEARVRTGVVIETRIMEVTLDDSTKYGIDWSKLDPSFLSLSGGLSGGATAAQGLSTGSTTFQLGVAGSKFTAFLDAQAQAGNLNVLSAPKVSTLNNQKAIIRIGRQDVFFRAVITPASTTSAAFTTYTPDSVTEGIILSVTPQVGQDGRIMLAIHPTVTEKVGEAGGTGQEHRSDPRRSGDEHGGHRGRRGDGLHRRDDAGADPGDGQIGAAAGGHPVPRGALPQQRADQEEDRAGDPHLAPDHPVRRGGGDGGAGTGAAAEPAAGASPRRPAAALRHRGGVGNAPPVELTCTRNTFR